MTAQSPMPDQLGPYRLVERIGEGGMGVVYLARDSSGGAVAVKVLRPGVAADPDSRRRLGREFETMRRVRCRFVAEVIDADVTGDMPYVVTRYVAGPSLDQLIARDGPLRGRALERVAWGLAEGLAAVHAAGVVHRDLKPGNVVMAGGVPVLIDFGIAHMPEATRITQVGMFMGTPGYLAPEVVEGQPFGSSADVHSWGSTVAFAATGRAPFGTGGYETIFYRIVAGQPDLSGVPAKLMPLVTAALGRNPGGRPTAMQLSADCAAIDLSGPDVPASAGAGLAGFGGRAAPAGFAGAAAGGAVGAGAVGAGVAAGGLGAGAAGAGAAAGLAGLAGLAGAGRVGAAAGVASGRAASPGTLMDGRPVLLPRPSRAGRISGLRPGSGFRSGSGLRSGSALRPGSGLGSGSGFRSGPGAGPGRRQQPAAIARDSFADVLPPVPYGAPPAIPSARPAAPPAGAAALATAARQPGKQAPSGVRRLLALLTMVIAVAASVLLPIAGTIVATAVIVLLRAADLAHGGLTRRRSERGARVSDVAVLVATAPWALVRALVGSVLLAPLAAACAAAAAAVTLIAAHTSSYRTAGAYAAGAFVAFYAFGVGSGKPRRQLGRLFGVAARRRIPAALTVTLLAVLTVALAGAAVTQSHNVWPLSPSLGWHGLRNLADQVASRLHRL